MEITDRGSAFMIQVRESPQINGLSPALGKQFHGPERVSGNAKGSPEIAPCAKRDKTHHHIIPDGALIVHKAVHDFVEGPVPAYANDQAGTLEGLPAGELPGIPRG